ncbi:T9SS type A sorting domain-containing protein [Formosa sp. PL04]|uniref:T9SS type A sorting domain-containing protein n=1 Tax=Formosa sp. PL04 TaxID=3081755 RepID=UPI0029812B62|nr:T9SS type A sorting domain-containing protein [Formosa sp. PL04]MDW5288787.1 T9SS type A sorting domain-containing protein [Formosa sp. PL04]
MKLFIIGLILLWSIGNLSAQNTDSQNKRIEQFFYRDSVISMQQWYNTDNDLDSLKTYHKTGELDESFYLSNKKFHGTNYKYNQKGKLVTTWVFDHGKLIKRTDHILEYTKQNEVKIIQFHTDLVAVNLALKETPNKTSLIAKRARIRTYLNDHILAINDYQKLIDILFKVSKNKNTPPPAQLLRNIYSTLATNYQALEMDNYVINYKLKAMVADPGNTIAIYNFSAFLYEIKSYELALYYLNKVIAIKPEHSFANSLLAAVYTEYDDYDKALYHINIAFKNEESLLKNGYGTEEQDLRTQRGYILHKLGKSDEGITDLNEALNLNENNSFAYRNLGVVYYDLEEYNLACENLEKAKNLGYEKTHDRYDLQVYLDYSCNYNANETPAIAIDQSINNLKLANKASIYPNPVKDVINIKNLSFKDYDFLIFDYSGKLLKQGNSKTSINISDLSSGVYILKIINNDLSETFRVIKD